jgi:hypothetical protein
MNHTPSYDGDLQMLRDTAGTIDLARLRFLRWLVDSGRLEHPPAGPPTGPLATPVRQAPALPDAA